MNNSLRITYWLGILLLGISLIMPIGGQHAVLAQSVIEKDVKSTQAVEKVLSDQVTAWNKGNLEGFMAGYWQSSELSFYSGKSTTRGWQETLDRYKLRYQSEGKEMGKLTFKDLEIEMLGSDNAFVRGKWQLELKSETVGGIFTLVFKRFPEGWRIIHDHTS